MIAGQNVQNGDKGPPALLGRPYEPRNHAVFFRRCGSVSSLCIRCGHDLAHFLRGWTGRAALVRDVAWAEGSPGRGHSTLTGAVHAFGDRTTVPERVTCPRLEWLAPGRAEYPRRCLSRWALGMWVGAVWRRWWSRGPRLDSRSGWRPCLHTALHPLHGRLRRPWQRRGRGEFCALTGLRRI